MKPAKCSGESENRRCIAPLLLVMMLATGPSAAAGCVDDCRRRYQSRLEICQLLYDDRGSKYYRNTRWRATCLEDARVDFDNCRAFC